MGYFIGLLLESNFFAHPAILHYKVYFEKSSFRLQPASDSNWPRGPMDKASAYGAGDCRFESCRGHLHFYHGMAAQGLHINIMLSYS